MIRRWAWIRLLLLTCVSSACFVLLPSVSLAQAQQAVQPEVVILDGGLVGTATTAVAPATIIFGADGRTRLLNLAWSGWGQPTAMATGTYEVDSGAAGSPQLRDDAGTVTASNLQTCDGRLLYTQLTLNFPGTNAPVESIDESERWVSCTAVAAVQPATAPAPPATAPVPPSPRASNVCPQKPTQPLTVDHRRHISKKTACKVANALLAFAIRGHTIVRCTSSGRPRLVLKRFDGYRLSLPHGAFTVSRGRASFTTAGTDFPAPCA